jgi:hypothetical protein
MRVFVAGTAIHHLYPGDDSVIARAPTQGGTEAKTAMQ